MLARVRVNNTAYTCVFELLEEEKCKKYKSRTLSYSSFPSFKADEDGGSRPNCFCHGWKDCHRFSAARVLGIVVEVQRDRFIIDDGTATATILRPPTLDAENGRSASDHAAAHGNGGAAAAASPPPPAASEPSADPPTHPKVGDLVECYGDLTEDRAVAAEVSLGVRVCDKLNCSFINSLDARTDPMCEPMYRS